MKKYDLFEKFDIEKYELLFFVWKEAPFFSTIFLIMISIILFIIVAIQGNPTALLLIGILCPISCCINYYVVKLLVSFPILHIHYLKNIRDNLDAIATNMNEKKE